ncbi:MAG: hypothetical protein ACOYBV_03915 [Candidatus Avilachnospira sp.]|jgi:uncharacterized membrane protein YjjP (DUF1212 family)
MKYSRILRVISFILLATTVGYLFKGLYLTALLAFLAAVVANPMFIRRVRLNKYVHIALFVILFLAAVYSVPYDHMESLIQQNIEEQAS